MKPIPETLQPSHLNPRQILSPLTILVTLLFFFLGCTNNEQQAKKEIAVEDDSLQGERSIVSEDSVMIFNNQTKNWIGQSIKKNTTDLAKFHLEEFWSDDSLQQKHFQPDIEFYKDYAQVLRWSPDSNYVLDIGSYGSVKVKDKDGKTRIEGGEPDTEVSMIYPKAKSKARLLFFGPGTVILDGKWLDSSQVAVMGINDEKTNNQPDTLLWIINARDNFFRKYKLE
jgi:hypothetical protein